MPDLDLIYANIIHGLLIACLPSIVLLILVGLAILADIARKSD